MPCVVFWPKVIAVPVSPIFTYSLLLDYVLLRCCFSDNLRFSANFCRVFSLYSGQKPRDLFLVRGGRSCDLVSRCIPDIVGNCRQCSLYTISVYPIQKHSQNMASIVGDTDQKYFDNFVIINTFNAIYYCGWRTIFIQYELMDANPEARASSGRYW